MESLKQLVFTGILSIILHRSKGQYCVPTYCSQSTTEYAILPADQSGQNHFYIGGIFGVHSAGNSFYECGPIRERGLHNLEAFLWSVKTYQDRNRLNLRGVNIGAIAFDSCSSSDKVIQQIHNLENCHVGYGNPPLEPSKVLAFVGPDKSAEAEAVAPIFEKLEKIIMSHAATSALLSDADKYPYFFRTVPSDESQADAIVSILREQNWKYVQLIHSGNTYGVTGAEAIKTAALANDICIVNSQSLDSAAGAEDVIKNIAEYDDTKVVIVFANDDFIRPLLQAAEDADLDTRFTWVGTNSWGDSSSIVEGLEDIAAGSLTLSLDDDYPQVREFREYMKTRKPEVDDPNPWFKEYWQEKFQCYLADEPEIYPNECDLDSQSLDDIALDTYVPYTILAVESVLNGIENARSNQCQNTNTWCSSFSNANNKLAVIYDQIRRSDRPVAFNQSTGDTLSARHIINNYRGPHGNCQNHCYTTIGSYEAADQKTRFDGVLFHYDKDGNRVDEDLRSTCPYPCTVCGESTTTTPAVSTTLDTRPTVGDAAASSTSPPLKMRDNSWIIALIVLAALGIVLVFVFEIYIMAKVSGAPFIKHWRTMWLGQLLLLAIFLCYATLFAFVPVPTTATCGIIRFGIGVTTSMIFAILIVKLMIILSSKSIGYLRGIFQGLMFFFAWGVQVVVDIQWLILRPPGVVRSNVTADGWVCEQGFEPHVQSLVYVMFLVVICTIIAIRSHGIITNHREGVFIGLAAGFTIPLWVAWILLGMLSGNKEFEDPAMAFGILLTATLVLFVMFLPKVRQLNSMGVEGIYVEDDAPDYTPSVVPATTLVPPAGSVVAGPGSVIGGSIYGSKVHVDPNEPLLVIPNGGTYAEPDGKPYHIRTNPNALYLKHPGPAPGMRAETASIRSAPMGYVLARKGPSSVSGDSIYATTRVLKMTNDLTGRMPGDDRATSEYNLNVSYGTARSNKSSRSRYAGSVTGSLPRSGLYKSEFSPSLQAHLERYEQV